MQRLHHPCHVETNWCGLWVFTMVSSLWNPCVYAADVVIPPPTPPSAQFDSGFLHGTGGMEVDVSRFERGNSIMPGEYLVDLVVNGQFAERVQVMFHGASGRAEAQPCIDRHLLERSGLNLSSLSGEERARLVAHSAGACIAPSDLPGHVSASFDQSRLRLNLLIPQAMILRQPRNYISPQLWDKGVRSATLRHDLNFYHSATNGEVTNSAYLRLDTGINLGTWHVRQSSSLTIGQGASHLAGIASYLVHDMPSIKSRLTIGTSFSDGAVFDSFGFRGIALATDDRMRPDSQSGYAPMVRGIARTNARVRITQNGILLLETSVSPGPFQIDDLYPTGYGGDLVVTVLEADGGQQSFKVPYAALPQMLRPGILRYSLAGGEFRDGGVYTGQGFVQGAVQYGLSNRLTGYGGGQMASGYAAGVLGIAFDTPVGAIAVDATVALMDLPGGETSSGYSLRASLAKTIPTSRTTMIFGAYRYSSEAFYALPDALHQRRGGFSPGRQRERFQATINQDLPGSLGRLYLSASTSRYWDRAGGNLQLQAGYHNVARLFGAGLNYGLTYVRQQDTRTGLSENRVLLSLSAALGNRPNAPQVFANITQTDAVGQSGLSGQVGISGALGHIPRLSYNFVGTTMADFDALSLGLTYRGKGATLTGNASAGTGFRQASLGMSGGIVFHPGGVTLSNRLEDTVAIVSAPGAGGARLRSGSDVVLDGRGHAVVPSIIPYRMNQIGIDPEGLPADVELKSTSRQIAPRSDAVVMVRFETVSGQAVLFHVTLADGLVVPFGATVSDAKGHEIGVTGQDGQIFLRTPQARGMLTVKWSDAADGACSFPYELPARPDPHVPVIEMAQTCRQDLPEKTL